MAQLDVFENSDKESSEEIPYLIGRPEIIRILHEELDIPPQ